MPINRLLKDSALSSDEVENLHRAFARAMRSLGLVDRDDPSAEIVAKKVIEVGATGLSDPVKISEITLKQLTVQPSNLRPYDKTGPA